MTVITEANNPTLAARAEGEKFGFKFSSTESAYIAEAVLASSGLRDYSDLAWQKVAPRVAELIVHKIRMHCTPSAEAYEKGGDFLVQAVADWIENPPDWVDAPWVVDKH